MTSLRKTIALACAASILSFGVAVAQTAAPADPSAAPAAGTAAPMTPDAGTDATTMKKPMMKKTMKKHMAKKHMKKKMM